MLAVEGALGLLFLCLDVSKKYVLNEVAGSGDIWVWR